MNDAPKNLLITGAAGGLGSALAEACARQGAQVLLLDANLKGLERTCDVVEAVGGHAPGYCKVDLSTAGPDPINELLEAFRGTYGELDGLVHCAARFTGLQPMEQVQGDEWLKSLQVNLNAAWLLSSLALPSLRSGPGGRLAFLLDAVRRPGGAYWGAYGVAKAGLAEMAAILASELEHSAVEVGGFSPGPMRTGLRATAFHAEDPTTVPEPTVAAEALASWLLTGAVDERLNRLV